MKILDKIYDLNKKIQFTKIKFKKIFKSIAHKSLIILLTLITIFLINFIHYVVKTNNQIKTIGVQAVNCMYNYLSLEDLNNNMVKLKNITTNEVYDTLTVDVEERALNTYLKFKGNAVQVEIINYTSSYVLYTLHTNSLAEGRYFVFFYTINNQGLINSVREMECLDFVPFF